MKFYPIHILIKDLTFFFILASMSDLFESTDSMPMTFLIALTMTRGTILINLIIQTILYFGFGRYFRFKSVKIKFLFGVGLHIITILYWLRALWTVDRTNMIIALTLSSLVSGLIYLLLNNKRLDNFVRKLKPMTKG